MTKMTLSELEDLHVAIAAEVKKEVAQSIRAEASRLDASKQNFTGWQAVQVSLRRIADALEAE